MQDIECTQKKNNSVGTPKAWTPDEIKELRERMGLTQSQFARQILGPRAKTTRQRVWVWEKGGVVPGAAVKRVLDLLEERTGRVEERGRENA